MSAKLEFYPEREKPEPKITEGDLPLLTSYWALAAKDVLDSYGETPKPTHGIQLLHRNKRLLENLNVKPYGKDGCFLNPDYIDLTKYG